jgi:hypothetical protein
MPNSLDDMRAMLQRSRSVADNADYLSLALSSDDQSQIENAVDDLLTAYDSYTGQARTYSSRLGFDEVAKLADSEKRDQATADALASALIDFEVAVVLGRAAQVTGEVEGQVRAADLDEAITTLNETLRVIEGPSGAAPGTTRFAFDEVMPAQGDISSPDVPTAKEAYAKQVKTFYDTLLAETTALLTVAFKEVSGLDADKIKEGLQAITGPIARLPGSRLVARALEATKRAIETLKSILGPKLLDKVEERLNKILDEIHHGEHVLHAFLKYSYGYDAGQKDIATWLQISQADHATIDAGIRTVGVLQQQMIQAFSLHKRIITTLSSLRWPLDWILKKFGGTLPLDLLMGLAFLLMSDIALLRGMDYADTTKIITFVEGILLTSKRTLGVG